MKQITVYIRDDQHEKLESEKNKSKVIRESLDLYYQKGDDNMKVVDVVELRENGVNVEESDNPVATRYFDDNGALPEGNFDDIAGWWIVIDGKVDVANDDVIWAYRTIDDTTLIKNTDLYFEFDAELAKELEIQDKYTKISTGVERYGNDLEFWAGFHKEDGRVTEVGLTEQQFLDLISE